MMSETIRFEVGKTYICRAATNYDLIYRFTVVKRTSRQVTLKEGDETYRRGVYVHENREWCKPHGTYSMCAVIVADRFET